jgi:transposase
MRLGWFRPVRCKTVAAQEARVLLTARKLVQSKLFDIEMSLRGILRGFGLKVGKTTISRFAARISKLASGHRVLEAIADALLWSTPHWREYCRLWRSECGASPGMMDGFVC